MLKQELDHSESQKLTQFNYVKKVEMMYGRLRDAMINLMELISTKADIIRDMFPEGGEM
jgi:hypothetical protein